jgi:hypothetical protein
MSSRDEYRTAPSSYDLDTAYPILTTQVHTGAPRGDGSAGGDLRQQATQAISDVLGWKWREKDTKAFVAALTGSFTLSRVEGHTEAAWTPRGYSIQADLGAVTGAQASLAARARSAVKDTMALLNSLVALRVDFNKEVGESFRSLVRHDLEQLRAELESPLVRVPRVDQLFDLLLFARKHTHGSDNFGEGAGGDVRIPGPTDPDRVRGHLGMLRDAFGLIPDNVDSINDERAQTSFITIVDWVVSLYYSWFQQRGKIDPYNLPAGAQGYFGPAMVAVSQLLLTTVNQVDELAGALDSVLINDAEREVLRVPLPADSSGNPGSMPLGRLLSWIRDFCTAEGPALIESAGKDGVDSAFYQVVERLRSIVHMLPSSPPAGRSGSTGEPPPWPPLPPGFFSRRVQIAIDALHDDLQELLRVVSPISHPDTGPARPYSSGSSDGGPTNGPGSGNAPTEPRQPLEAGGAGESGKRARARRPPSPRPTTSVRTSTAQAPPVTPEEPDPAKPQLPKSDA